MSLTPKLCLINSVKSPLGLHTLLLCLPGKTDCMNGSVNFTKVN